MSAAREGSIPTPPDKDKPANKSLTSLPICEHASPASKRGDYQVDNF